MGVYLADTGRAVINCSTMIQNYREVLSTETGYLKAVWPEFVGIDFEAPRAKGLTSTSDAGP